MGNQTLVPSQIQSVESYFLDLKSYIQFKSSLGSTTFMKTAKVVLIENYLDDYLLDTSRIHPSNIVPTSNPQLIAPANQTVTNNISQTPVQPINTSATNTATTSPVSIDSSQNQAAVAAGITHILSSNNKLNQQRYQQLKELQQQVVVKIFPKYDLSIRLDLYTKRVKEIKNIIYSRYGLCTNCIPFSDLVITDRAAFLFRQYIKYNLYDRISTRPFLSLIEKKWIAFQLLCAVNEIHSLQIVHGDMKIENVLVNSFLWVSLADFASYKPVYLSKNHPSADFNYYFDISRRRTCYLAPERLDSTRGGMINQQSPTQQTQAASNTDHEVLYELMPPDPNDFKSSMDIFSLGCIIAELFMERPLFDFAHLLAYRDHKYDPIPEMIAEIGGSSGDKNILDMILSMLSLDPNQRKSANEYLQEQNDRAFPSYFVYLKNYISRFISANQSADEIVIRLKNDLPLLLKNLKLNQNELSKEDEESESDKDAQKTPRDDSMKNTDPEANDAFLILLSLLLSCVRKLKFAENKLIAIDLMTSFSKFLNDSIILDRILPYYLSLLEETPNQMQSPIVKSHVIYALNDCLSNIYKLDVQNLNIFPEIIFDCLEKLSRDESFLVRSTVAKTISNFALTSLRYLDTVFLTRRSFLNSNNPTVVNQNLITTANSPNNSISEGSPSNNNSNQNLSTSCGAVDPDHQDKSGFQTGIHGISSQDSSFDKDKLEKYATYDKEYDNYQRRITEIVMHLMTDMIHPSSTSSSSSSSSSNAVKETLIRSDISKLCAFFSRQKTSEFLLPHMITILNEKTDWSVRAAFFDALCPVLTCIGWESVEIVKSLLEQGLRDSEEFVIHRTLITLSKMVEIGLLDRQQICYFLSTHVTPLLCHPSLWIRHGAVNFITIVCRQNTSLNKSTSSRKEFTNNGLNTADILCSVAPLLSKFLQRKDLLNYDKEEILFNCLKKPIKRAVYDCICQEGRSDQLFSYLNQRSEIRLLTNQNYLPGYVDCSDPNVQRFFEKLCKLGFIEEDEDKLLHMKEFIDKTRISRLSSSLHNTDNMMMMTMSANNSITSSNQWNSQITANNTASNAQVLAPKENYTLKDGYITIMKDKFQKCNTEYFNSRQTSSQLMAYEQLQQHQQQFLDSKSHNNNNSHKQQIEEAVNQTSTDNSSRDNYNPEWKFMFGNNNTTVNTNVENKASQTRPESAKSRIIKPQILLNHQLLSSRKNTNCLVEVEKYLDRCKFVYDEHRRKEIRVSKFKETINSSTSSNIMCLSSSIGKWKPKGYSIVHSNEHTKDINKLSRNSDSTYFSTCSTSESVVKIWSTENLLDARSGYFRSVFTYDRQNKDNQDNPNALYRPCCTTFHNKNSLAILCEDFRFYIIDFYSNRTQYLLSENKKLFRANTCKLHAYNSGANTFDKSTFYYLNKLLFRNQIEPKCGPRSCYCTSNYPVEMINIGDTSPSWPVAANNVYDYFVGNKSSPVKGLFCYSTSTGDFSCIDMRTRTKAFDIRRDLRRGYVTTMITDPWYTWLAMGTSNGNIEIYDFRFMQPVQTFEHRSKTSVVRMCNHPMLKNRIIASYQGNNEIAMWNMENVRPTVGSKLLSDPEFVFWGVQSVPPLCQNKISSSYISGLVGFSAGEENGSNGLICASSDMKLRYIDLNNPTSDSYIISSAFNIQQNGAASSVSAAAVAAAAAAASSSTTSGSVGNASLFRTSNEFASSLMSQNVSYEQRQIEGTKVLIELDNNNSTGIASAGTTPGLSPSASYSYNIPALTHQSYFTHHQDAISDLIVCYNPVNNKNQPLIITSARDGTLKIWR